MHQDLRDQSSAAPPCPMGENRRGFLQKTAAAALGLLAMLTPVLAGLAVVLDPLRRRSDQSTFIHITSLRSVPEDGLPRKFAVIASHSDAWTRTPAVPIGAVYLRRKADGGVQAFNVVCPHAGCFVDFNRAKKQFICPCHHSVFALDGRISDRRSPSPRGLDRLEVEVRNQGEVWVKFQNYLAGHARRIPVV